MALTLTVGRTSFKVCHKEGSRTTVWDVSSEDSEEKLIQTFKDIISFVEGEPSSPSPLGAPGYALIQAAKAAAGYPPVSPYTLGWAKPLTEPPPVPAGADYELIPPEEQA